ncbi:hypothetical protein QFC24_005388 [Naganishia onofrii]|uniref:Uncharacterized protein n=1 Tax=Naganishia onofrii TaxID=1851511 RepID=A0ACC2X774_9TREE|nr:hypothetical protein QFC24_005388 [Naganishia onofrii]
MRKLEAVASTRRSGASQANRRRLFFTEIGTCFLLPVIHVALQYIVQGHRYDVRENVGCVIPVLVSWPTVLLTYVPPLFVSLAAAVYAGLNTGRYLRLISLAIADVCLVIFGSLFTMTHDLKISGGLRPYLSWHDAHQNFGQITQITEDWFTSASTSDMSVLGGLFPVYSFTFFILFGFGEEAIREYLRLGKLLANNWMSFRFKR